MSRWWAVRWWPLIVRPRVGGGTQRLLPAVRHGRENGTPWIGRGSGSGQRAAQLALKAGGEQLRYPDPRAGCSSDFYFFFFFYYPTSACFCIHANRASQCERSYSHMPRSRPLLGLCGRLRQLVGLSLHHKLSSRVKLTEPPLFAADNSWSLSESMLHLKFDLCVDM